MVGKLLMKGMMAGLIAGLLTFAYFKAFGEPWVDSAITFEEQVSAAAEPAGSHPEPEIVSRETQAGTGLLTGVLVYGAAIGGFFAICFALANGRLGRLDARSTAMLLAALGFTALILVPALKYPANPPAVGSADTIGERTQLFFAMLSISIVAMIAAVTMAKQLWTKAGGWNASLLAGAFYIVVVAIGLAVLPSVNEVSETFPANTLWNFRFASLSGHVIFWAALAIAFDALRRWGSNAANEIGVH